MRQKDAGFMKYLLAVFLILTGSTFSYGQVRIRLFTSQVPESVVFTVTAGEYSLIADDGIFRHISKGDPVFITCFREKIAVKARNDNAFICDSLLIRGETENDNFSLRINSDTPVIQFYSGDLRCFYDLNTLMLINICGLEKYIAGVVNTEGGSGKNKEYIKSQALLVRTYMFKYYDRHIIDKYNLCDNTHCQAFNGITSDTLIINAVKETEGLVVLAGDSTLVISAFHSNCGGETSPSEDVWLAGYTYLKKVTDPYCTSSRNATWQKSIVMSEWLSYLKKEGFAGSISKPSDLNFSQRSRMKDYMVGSFALPLNQIRTDLNLRSSFFSVVTEGDSVILKGRGYGHGVGLCQEGAMVMAEKGFNFRQIIGFYYQGVIITDIKNARKSENGF